MKKTLRPHEQNKVSITSRVTETCNFIHKIVWMDGFQGLRSSENRNKPAYPPSTELDISHYLYEENVAPAQVVSVLIECPVDIL